MADQKFTPGPWATYLIGSGRWVIEAAEGTKQYRVCAHIAVLGACYHSEANARLIAKSPELVAMVGELISAMHQYQMDVEEDPPFKHREMMKRAEALLRDIEGETG